jgi:hypothetical protein
LIIQQLVRDLSESKIRKRVLAKTLAFLSQENSTEPSTELIARMAGAACVRAPRNAPAALLHRLVDLSETFSVLLEEPQAEQLQDVIDLTAPELSERFSKMRKSASKLRFVSGADAIAKTEALVRSAQWLFTDKLERSRTLGDSIRGVITQMQQQRTLLSDRDLRTVAFVVTSYGKHIPHKEREGLRSVMYLRATDRERLLAAAMEALSAKK